MMSDEFDVEVQRTLESNRQWLREHNIAHAKLRIKKAKTTIDKKLWVVVLESYGQLMQSETRHVR